MLAQDEDAYDDVVPLLDECLAIVAAVVARYERGGDLTSAAVLAEGAATALQDWLPANHGGVRALGEKARTYERALSAAEQQQARCCRAARFSPQGGVQMTCASAQYLRSCHARRVEKCIGLCGLHASGYGHPGSSRFVCAAFTHTQFVCAAFIA